MNKYRFEDREPEIDSYVSYYWEDGSICECIHKGLDKTILPLPTHWSYVKETPEEAAEAAWTTYEYEEGNLYNTTFKGGFLLGAKWQAETENKYFVKYMKSEQDFQIERMSKLGINTTGQCFEQMVTSLIQLAERRYSEENVKKISLDFFYHWWNAKGTNTEQGFDEWFKEYKTK